MPLAGHPRGVAVTHRFLSDCAAATEEVVLGLPRTSTWLSDGRYHPVMIENQQDTSPISLLCSRGPLCANECPSRKHERMMMDATETRECGGGAMRRSVISCHRPEYSSNCCLQRS